MDLTKNVENPQVVGGIEGEGVIRSMEWEKKQQHQHQHQQQTNGGGVGISYIRVMTDEQMDLLRKQIAIYGTICVKLVEMHKTMTANRDLPGVRLGNAYYDPYTTSAGQKISTRQRWTPTPMQLQALEHIFDQGTGTPSKQKIKDITNELTQHGPISETNVYNWFQNRRARSKRKQNGAGPNNAESEVDTEVDSLKEKSPKSNENPALKEDELCLQSSETSSQLHSLNQLSSKAEMTFPSDVCSKSSGNLGDVSFYDSLLWNPRIDHLMGKMEVPGSYYPYRQGDGYE